MTAVLLAGCGSFASVTPRGPRDPAIPGLHPTIGQGGGTVLGPEAQTRRTAGPNSRIICRNAGVPNGYVAIDYTTSTSCMQSADTAMSYNSTLILDLRTMPGGSVVVMCRDQRVPRDWYRTYNDEESGRCLRAGGPKGSKSNTVEIRKQG